MIEQRHTRRLRHHDQPPLGEIGQRFGHPKPRPLHHRPDPARLAPLARLRLRSLRRREPEYGRPAMPYAAIDNTLARHVPQAGVDLRPSGSAISERSAGSVMARSFP
jgi:hypothetical protein